MSKVAKKKDEEGAIKPRRQAPRPQAAASNRDKKPTEKKGDESNKKELVMVSRREHEELKRRAIKYETTNRRRVLLIPCDGDKGWYEMGDTSALIYKYEVCDALGARVWMDNDYDSFYAQFVIGRIRVRDVDTVRKRLRKVGLYESEEEKDKCVLFVLKKRYSEDEIKFLQNGEMKRQEKINNIAKIEVVDPPLYRLISAVGLRIHKAVLRDLDKIYRPTMGEKMMAMMVEIMTTYYDIARKKAAVAQNKERWTKIYNNLDELVIRFQILSEQRALNRDDCAEIGERLIEIKQSVMRHMR